MYVCVITYNVCTTRIYETVSSTLDVIYCDSYLYRFTQNSTFLFIRLIPVGSIHFDPLHVK